MMNPVAGRFVFAHGIADRAAAATMLLPGFACRKPQKSPKPITLRARTNTHARPPVRSPEKGRARGVPSEVSCCRRARDGKVQGAYGLFVFILI
jgi:hypothetical protein